METVEDFDRLVDEAWPATRREFVHGWWLRQAGGVTKRANSVWPAGAPDDVRAAIAAAERFYADQGIQPSFTISGSAQPRELDGMLAARGYEVVDPTLIMTTELCGDRPVTRPVDIAGSPSRDWLAAWWSVDGRYGDGLDAAAAIVTGVPATYATAGDAVGRGVPQSDWLGVYCMAVLPQARRQGLARDVLHALLNDGRARGARRAYLCVTERNAAARALYEQAGFQVAARYHYRVLDTAAGAAT